MIKSTTKLLGLFLLGIFIGNPVDISHASGARQDQITFSQEQTQNNFPDQITFSITVESADSEITAATLYYYFRNDISRTRQLVELEPRKKVNLNYTYDTRKITVPPGTLFLYYWEAVDSAGNRVRSEEFQVFYDDVRFKWQVLEDQNLAVWWHNRPDEFGETVFRIAQQAFAKQKILFQADLEFQIRIIISNSFDEFAAWHTYVNDFVGGQAFVTDGLTVQIVPKSDLQERWLNDVIPHEISHLYLYQVTYNPLTEVPQWLDEGVAQYNEFAENERALEHAAEVIAEGGLLPLWSLTGSFGNQEENFRFAYDEAISATTYIVETYGEDGLARLLAAFKNGHSGSRAFEEAFGRDIFEFQEDWLVWMGVSPKMYPTPTVRPTIPWATAPAYGSTSTPLGFVAEEPASKQPSPVLCWPAGIILIALLSFGMVWVSKRATGT